MDSECSLEGDSIDAIVVAKETAYPARVMSLGDDNTRKLSKKRVYECDRCGKQFNKAFNMKRHTLKVCCRQATAPEPVKVVCPLCGFEDVKQVMAQHFETGHGIALSRKSFLFESRIEFLKWKGAKELETNARYVQSRGARPTKNGLSKVTYYCHRDGHFKSKGLKVRKMKAIGSNKINGHCPARMDTSDLPDGMVEVKFVETHLGHSMDSSRVNLTEDQREQVARLIKCEPVEESHDVTYPNLTAERLSNISRSFKTFHYVRKRDINESFDDWVESIINSSNMVRLYEKHGDDFIFVSAMDSQIEILRQFANQTVLLEPISKHFWCLLVVDDTKEGFPCAFLLSTGGKNALEKFLTTVKSVAGTLEPKLVISDFEGLQTWVKVFNQPTCKAVASRHIDRACGDNATSLALIECAELSEGSDFLKAFKDTSSKFVVPDLFKDDYALWARCLQQPFIQETDAVLKPTVRLLKYLDNRYSVFQAPDKLLYSLIKATRDHIFDRILVLNNGSKSIRQKRLESRHKLSQKLSIDNVVENPDNTYTIPGTIESYTVKRSTNACNCKTVCHECRSCVHQYACTCLDSIVKGFMCRHIHLVCRFLLAREDPLSLDDTDIDLSRQKELLVDHCVTVIESLKSLNDLNDFESHVKQFQVTPSPKEVSYVLQLVTDEDSNQKEINLLEEGQQFVMILDDGRNTKVELVKEA